VIIQKLWNFIKKVGYSIMPVEASFRNLHSQLPGAVEGYELSPGSGKGLWSIVSPSGVVTNLNDLGLQVTAYTGAGMPPIENVTSPFGILGGSLLQRTVIRPRTIVLSCVVQGRALATVQRIKNAIIAQIAPYNSLSSSKTIKLHYQLVNNCGDLIGTALEVSVTYAGDLTGQTTNLYQDRFDLQFVELNPPSIKELTTNTVSLSYLTTRAAVTGIRYRTSTGDWKFISLANPLAVHYDANGELWYSSNATVTNRSGSVTQAVNNNAYVITHDQSNNIYVGGQFTTPQNYIMKYNGSVWSAVGATINGTVYGLAFDNSGNLYACGAFTTPVGAVGKWDGSSWSALGTGTNGNVYAIVKGLDGNIYIGGNFTTANGVSCSRIAMWNGTTFVPLGAGITGGGTTVYSLSVLPDGRIVAGGNFTFAGGVACSFIAIWNGTQWQPLGNGLNNAVTKVFANPVNGDIYAGGPFSGSGTVTLPSKFAKFNGSSWVPQDANNSSSTVLTGQIDIRASDGELALGTDISSATISNGVLNTITYSGTADVFPRIKFTGPGILNVITNYSTGKSIYFNNYTMLAGETATLTLGPSTGVSFISSFYGNVIGRILPGSDLTSFSLVPGTNYITPYITGASGATLCQLLYENTHYSFEAGAI
jgi:hypothetical protein